MSDEIEPREGDFFEGILLETCRDVERSISRPRVRPVDVLPNWLRVEFPRHLRDDNPIKTRFRADVHVRQKHNANGTPKGPLYLRADNHTIRKISDYTPNEFVRAIRRNSISGRAYFYIEDDTITQSTPKSFDDLRRLAIANSIENATVRLGAVQRRERSELIREYALLRANGTCEGCQKPAPFLSRNGEPYLEVHHIVALASGGADHPSNVAGICPNCHTRITYGKDGEKYNLDIAKRVAELELMLGS